MSHNLTSLTFIVMIRWPSVTNSDITLKKVEHFCSPTEMKSFKGLLSLFIGTAEALRRKYPRKLRETYKFRCQ